jgi:transposase
LRYHHVDGLNIDEIGAIYRVHRVTAFRWLEKAKEQLVRGDPRDPARRGCACRRERARQRACA